MIQTDEQYKQYINDIKTEKIFPIECHHPAPRINPRVYIDKGVDYPRCKHNKFIMAYNPATRITTVRCALNPTHKIFDYSYEEINTEIPQGATLIKEGTIKDLEAEGKENGQQHTSDSNDIGDNNTITNDILGNTHIKKVD